MVDAWKLLNNYTLGALKQRFFLLLPKQQMDTNLNCYMYSVLSSEYLDGWDFCVGKIVAKLMDQYMKEKEVSLQPRKILR